MPRKPVRKSAAKKSAAKKGKFTAKKSLASSSSSSSSKKSYSFKDAPTKSQLVSSIADATGFKKIDVNNILFKELPKVIAVCLSKKGPGEFNLPGLLKCRVVRKPATKARDGINPFTGEPTVFKAKPARNVVKVRPLKKLKEMVE